MNDKKFDLKNILLSDGCVYFLIFLILCGFFCHSNFSALRIIPGFLLFIILIFKFILNRKNNNINFKPIFGYVLWGVSFLLYSGISIFWANDKIYALQLLKDMIYIFSFIFLIIFFITDSDKLKKIVHLFIATCIYSSIIILAFNNNLVGTDNFGMITGLYFNRIALLLCYGIFFCFYLYKKNHKKKYILFMLLFYFVIYLTGSRKSIIMPIIFISIFLLLNIGKDKKKFFKTMIGLGILIGLFLIFINISPTLKTGMKNLVQSIIYSEKTNDGSINERTFFRKTGLELFESSPIVGIGINGFRGYLASINYKHITYSHCNQLELLATLGIIGFLIYYILYTIIIRNSLKNFKSNNLEKILCISFIITVFIFEYGYVSFYFFENQISLAFIYFYSVLSFKKKSKDIKKIGILIPSLNTGGAERTAVSLANWLATNTKNEIFLINLGKNDNNYVINKKVKVYSKKHYVAIKGRIMEYIKLIIFLNKQQFDILFEMLFTPLKYAIIHRFFNSRVVIIGSERANPKKYNTFFKKMRCKIYPLFCDGYIFQTQMVRDMFFKTVKNNSIVIPNAISNPDILEIDTKKIKKKKTIVAVGRLTEQKGFDILIKSFIKFHEKFHDYKLIIYGEGVLRKELEKLIKENNMENYIYLPGNKKNVMKDAASATMFVMSSRYEGMPNALLEAMSIGMPCISTNCVAGPSELIKNYENGILIEVDSIEKMNEAMVQIIENKSLRNKISKNSLKVKETHLPDQIYSQYYSYFLDVYNQKNES